MEQHLDNWDDMEDLDGDALAARMRLESEEATQAYGEALAAAGYDGAGWGRGWSIGGRAAIQPAWRRITDEIAGRYGVSFDELIDTSPQSRSRRARRVRVAGDHVFFALVREHGLQLATVATLFDRRSPGTVCKGALRHEARQTGG